MNQTAIRHCPTVNLASLSGALALGLIAALFLAEPAHAYTKASSLTCAQMRAAIRKNGRAYFFTRRGHTERFVDNAAYCTSQGQRMGYYSVIDKNKQYCNLRRCTSSNYFDDYND